jgi:trimeric autotransporter adhesin
MALSKPANAAIELGIVGTLANDTAAVLFGTADDDIISGGSIDIESTAPDGTDVMEGGAGNDTYIVRETADTVIELIDEGVDTVWSSATFILAAEVENIGASGTATTTLTGNAKNNILDGSQATGINTLVGGTGSDTYYLGAGDLVTEAVSGGTDTVIISEVVAAAVYNITSGANIATSPISAGAIENVQLTGSADANIIGNALNNRLSGNSGVNNITAGAGNDTLDTGAGGADILSGEAGNDTYIIRTGATATIADSAGVDTVKTFVTYDGSLVTTGIENITLMGATAINATGNALINVLTGNGADNTLIGGAGADTLIGGAGTNALQGGTGNDIYVITNATDTITGELGGAEVDTVQYGVAAGTFTLATVFNVENITLTGTAANATGNTLNNVINGNASNNTLNGGTGTGNDTLNGNDGADVLTGGDGNDSLNGGNQDDTLNGDAGIDTLTGGAATTATSFNTLNGGAGNDTYVVVNSEDVINETTTVGEIDTVQFAGTAVSDLSFTLATDVENITLTGALATSATGNASANSMTGNAAINTLNGGAGNDTLNGGLGNDILIGGADNDSLIGSTGNDTMSGNAGSDTYSVDSLTDVVNESVADGGADIVNSTVTFNLGVTANAGVETLTLGGTAAINGTGNALNNFINGNTGVNTLSGLAGTDTINAGAGNDIITGGAGKDTVITGTGDDTVKFTAATDSSASSGTTNVDVYSDLLLNAVLGGDVIDISALNFAAGDVVSGGAAITGVLAGEASFVTNMNALLTTNGFGFDGNATTGLADFGIVTGGVGSAAGLLGHTFLAVDADGSETFTATDFVIEITGSSFATIGANTFFN